MNRQEAEDIFREYESLLGKGGERFRSTADNARLRELSAILDDIERRDGGERMLIDFAEKLLCDIEERMDVRTGALEYLAVYWYASRETELGKRCRRVLQDLSFRELPGMLELFYNECRRVFSF